MEDGSIRTKEIVSVVVGTYVKNLALGIYIGVVTRELLSVATETSFRNFAVYRVIATGFAGYS